MDRQLTAPGCAARRRRAPGSDPSCTPGELDDRPRLRFGPQRQVAEDGDLGAHIHRSVVLEEARDVRSDVLTPHRCTAPNTAAPKIRVFDSTPSNS